MQLIPFRRRRPESPPLPPPRPTEAAVAKFLELAQRRPVAAAVVEHLVDDLLADEDRAIGGDSWA